MGTQPADSGSALDVDAHDHILARSQRLAYMVLGDTFVVAIDDRVFQQLIGLDHPSKLTHGDEVVIHAVPFVGASRPRRCGNNEIEWVLGLLEQLQYGILANTAGPEITTKSGRAASRLS